MLFTTFLDVFDDKARRYLRLGFDLAEAAHMAACEYLAGQAARPAAARLTALRAERGPTGPRAWRPERN